MIYTEDVSVNGRVFVRTCSDAYTIERDGVEYDEAIDPVDSGRVYTETENLLPPPDVEDNVTEEDYIDALNELGVTFNEKI